MEPKQPKRYGNVQVHVLRQQRAQIEFDLL